MAMIKCAECGQEISDKAKKCIHCGNPLKGSKASTLKRMSIIIVVTGAILVCINFIISSNQLEKTEKTGIDWVSMFTKITSPETTKITSPETTKITSPETTKITSPETTKDSARFGSRTNVMKMGDSITLPYSDWNSGSDGEITVSAISNKDGKTTVNIALESETRNNPFVVLSDQLSSAYTVPAVQFLETDDPMTFVWGNGSTDDYLKANDGATIAEGSSQDIVYNTHKQYLVIVSSVLKDTDKNTTYDITSGNYNCYYTFIQLY